MISPGPGPGVLVCDVGPRDGLQNEDRILTAAQRADLINELADAGCPRIEAVSFVNPKRVPQMAHAEEVMERIVRSPSTTYSGLVLNIRGAERAVDCGIDRINFAFAVTETFNQRNQGSTVQESLAAFEQIAELARDADIPCTATLGASFGCPFEGPVPAARVAKLAAALANCGADELVISDTIGVGVPTQVSALTNAVRDVAENMTIGCHFHNTRNTGIANAATALAEGVRLLDASVGGAGGCPFAPKATGNICTEDLVYMLHGMGYETGIDLPNLLRVAEWLESELGHQLPGMVKQAGLNWHPASAEAKDA
ncbi:MAG: hydroxymethylglutaryl-CoA lyase [Propionibacteriales bacterium]|nr:hydroxymethylglutaryl-CoA lyase [Propionibacteriales bacterium]